MYDTMPSTLIALWLMRMDQNWVALVRLCARESRVNFARFLQAGPATFA